MWILTWPLIKYTKINLRIHEIIKPDMSDRSDTCALHHNWSLNALCKTFSSGGKLAHKLSHFTNVMQINEIFYHINLFLLVCTFKAHIQTHITYATALKIFFFIDKYALKVSNCLQILWRQATYCNRAPWQMEYVFMPLQCRFTSMDFFFFLLSSWHSKKPLWFVLVCVSKSSYKGGRTDHLMWIHYKHKIKAHKSKQNTKEVPTVWWTCTQSCFCQLHRQ